MNIRYFHPYLAAETPVPPIALALHGVGKAAIVAAGKARLDQLQEEPYKVDLPGGVRVVARLGELIYADGSGVGEPDAVAASPEEAMRLALSLAKQPIHASTRKQLRAIGSQVSPHGTGLQDAGHRVLAAVQIWGVFHYFFPYKDLMGEDWDAVLREFSISTPQALMWKAMERFMNGPDNSTAVLTLRGGSGQVKEVKVTRSRSYWSGRFEQSVPKGARAGGPL